MDEIVVIEKEARYDLLPDSFSVLLYTGKTGCGKTYTAINKAKKGKFAIAVPTRQLAYEIALDYKDVISFVSTGEVKLSLDSNNKGSVYVYENLDIDNLDTLIIDEAHFLNDEDRGVELLNKVISAISKGVEVILLTATNSFDDEFKRLLHIIEVELKPFKEVTITEIDSYSELKEKIEAEKLTVLVFTKYKPNEWTVEDYCYELGIDLGKADYISADIPTSKRVESQIKFKRGDLQLVVSSNVLAQGVNFPADIVIIEYNEWDSWELIDQKIGRVGRPQYKDKGYYYLHFVKPEKHKRKKPKKAKTTLVQKYRGIDISSLNIRNFEIPYSLYEFGGYKYSKKLLTYLKQIGKANEEEINALNNLIDEEKKLKDILLNC